jgi:hypothetical protein
VTIENKESRCYGLCYIRSVSEYLDKLHSQTLYKARRLSMKGVSDFSGGLKYKAVA